MSLPADPIIVGASTGTQIDPIGIGGAAVSPNDNTDLAHLTRGVYVGTGGDLVVILAGMTTTLTFHNVKDGSLLPLVVRRVMSTNTTADNILALW